MMDWASCVTPEGELDPALAAAGETVYTGKSGKPVIRFRLDGQGYIFKPLSHPDTAGREQWAARVIAPLLPDIAMPVIVAEGGEPGGRWMMYEDIGRLAHGTAEADIRRAAALVPLWHKLDPALAPAAFGGHTPLLAEAAAAVRRRPPEQLAAALDMPTAEVRQWLDKLERPGALERLFGAPKLSHGDYYPENVAFVGGAPVVLDWEFVHVNSVYWDLYSIMDLTSMRYSREVLAPGARERILADYWRAVGGDVGGRDGRLAFTAGYFGYAAVYSAWICGLVADDLAAGRWERDALLSQRDETRRIFAYCYAQFI